MVCAHWGDAHVKSLVIIFATPSQGVSICIIGAEEAIDLCAEKTHKLSCNNSSIGLTYPSTRWGYLTLIQADNIPQ